MSPAPQGFISHSHTRGRGSVEDRQVSIGVFVHAHRGAREMGSQRARRDLQAQATPLDGVVVAHAALLLDVQDLAHPAGAISERKRCRPRPASPYRTEPAAGSGPGGSRMGQSVKFGMAERPTPQPPHKRVFPVTDGGHRSFSASLRNSSGTEREIPSATDPYPTASHPKRSRILSTAQSAAQRAMPFLVPGRRVSSLSPSGSSS